MFLPVITIVEPAPAFMRMPDIHQDQVVFVCEGDLWLGSLTDGSAFRLTRDAGREEYPRFSPDGKTIAFSAQYEGVTEVYTISASGGAPTRLTYRNDYAEPMDWSADGTSVLYRARTFPRSYGLYQISAKGGPEKQLPVEFASSACVSPGGNRIAFTRFNRWDDAWFRYEGGMQNQIWTGDLDSKSFKKVTEVAGTNEYPTWEGNRLYFVNEKSGSFTVMSVSESGGRVNQVSPSAPFETRELNSGPNALIYEKGRGIEVFDLKAGKASTVNFPLHSDLMHTRPYSVPAAPSVQQYSLTPTAQRVMAEARGQLLTLPVGEGEARIWKSQPGVRLGLPLSSPDGKSVAYVSDETGESQIVVSKADGTEPKNLTSDGKRQIKMMTWSPDSKWLLYFDSNMRLKIIEIGTGKIAEVDHSNLKSWFGVPHSFSPDSQYLAYSVTDGITEYSQTVVRELATGETKTLGSGFTHDTAPAFSQDGKFLVFVSRRTFPTNWDAMVNQMNTGDNLNICAYMLYKDVPNPLALKDPQEPEKTETVEPPKTEKLAEPATAVKKKIEFDGIESRLLITPMAAGNYNQVALVGMRLIYANEGQIGFAEIGTKTTGTITAGAFFALSTDGKKMLVGDRVIDVAGKDVPPATGKLSTGGLRLQVQPLVEWKQMYWDAWRLLRDYFYVRNMHGLDWDAIGKKYAVFLPSVRSRDELDVLIRWLQAELGSSHQYLTAGDEQNLKPTVAGAYLGIEVDADLAANKLMITKILRGDGVDHSERSPLIQPGFEVKEGDYLLAIAGQAMTADSSYLQALSGRAGQTISVTIASKADGSDKRTAYVKPFDLPKLRRIGVIDWVARNREYVDKASGGKIGYIYLQAMTQQDMSDFLRQYYPLRGKDALLIDTRFNNGGNTQNVINRVLAEKLDGFFNMRESKYPWTRQGDYFAGPMALVVNEFNVSCGEEFPHRFRDLKLGKIFGRRTYGGEVGSSPGWPLMDGGVVSVPNYGMWTYEKGWVIEGPGFSPDVDVPSDPNAFVKGEDPQLDVSIKHLLDEIKKNPVRRPTQQPPDPVRTKGDGLH